MSKQIITTTEESQGRRLDHFLVEQLSDLSRSQIQKLIKNDLVLVNGSVAMVHKFLKVGDKIEILSEAESKNKTEKTTQVEKNKNLKFSSITERGIWKKIKIIDDTEDYLIIEKPSGLLVHPTTKAETNTLIDWATDKYPQIAKIGDEPGRAGIVHRLDKDVSGLMVLPKTQSSFEYFKRLFKIRQIEKKYVTLAIGKVKADEGEINFPIARSKNKSGLYAALPLSSEEGKPAKTIYHVLQRFVNYTLLEVQILTGRTHQIRVHLLAFGHPVAGDTLYGSSKKQKEKPERIFLHAASLKFIDPSGEVKEYKSELPGGLKDFLKKIK